MWFGILRIVLGVLFVSWLACTNGFRHWRRRGAEPGGRYVGSASARAADDVNGAQRNRSGLRKRPYD